MMVSYLEIPPKVAHALFGVDTQFASEINDDFAAVKDFQISAFVRFRGNCGPCSGIMQLIGRV